MYFIEGRFLTKVAILFVCFIALQRTEHLSEAERLCNGLYSAPNRTGQKGQAPLFVQQQHKK